MGVHHYVFGDIRGSQILRALTFHEKHSRRRRGALSLREEDLVWAFSTKVRDLLSYLFFIILVFSPSQLEVHGLLRLSLSLSLDI